MMIRIGPLLVTLVLPCSTWGQTFTSVQTGDLVADGGASRSVNWVDVNGDGYPDLFVSNGLEAGENNLLYINNGPDSSFTFGKAAGDPIVSDMGRSDGSTWGDMDNDGDLDAFVVNWYGDNNLMYSNNGNGTFVQVLNDPATTDGGHSETAALGDFDNDGDLDLIVTNSGSSVTGPLANFLYSNNGNGDFTKVDTGAVSTDRFYSRGATWLDFDLDGDQDLFIANERNQKNLLYRNVLSELGTPSFVPVTDGHIVTAVASSWSGSWGDYDNDGDPDLFVANGWPYAQNDYLYRNNGDGTFDEVGGTPVTSDAAFSACGAWGDYDNDGDLDLFVTTAYSGSPTTNMLYRNLLLESGSAEFEEVVDGEIVNDAGDSYGCAWDDYNADGFLDLFVARTQNENQNNRLYRNDATNGNHWLRIGLTGTVSNRSGIGSVIRVKSAPGGQSVWQSRTIAGQTGYCGQSLIAHFGLGGSLTADSVVVEWPSGTVDVLVGFPVDQHITITEGMTVSVDEGNSAVPDEFHLYQNYPNPFNPSTRIRYRLDRSGFVRLEVFDVLGRRAGVLVDGVRAPGLHEVTLSAESLPSSGTYTYVLSFEDESKNRQMVYIK